MNILIRYQEKIGAFCFPGTANKAHCIYFLQNGLIELIYDLERSEVFEVFTRFNIHLVRQCSIQEWKQAPLT